MMIPGNMPEKTLAYPRFLASELDPIDPDEALFHVIPVPYEKTVTSGKGTRKGPSAILEASQQLELFDGKGVPGERGIYTDAVHDCKGAAEMVLGSLADRVERIVQQAKIPVVLGGEHTISAGALKGVVRRNGPIGLVQFDAHSDLRDHYEGSKYNHACVMRRALEMGIRLFQLGVRSLSVNEVVYRKRNNIEFLDAGDIAARGIPEPILPGDFPATIYISFDVDCLDPSIMPSTGTPEPGGLTWYQTVGALSSICRQRSVVGFDVVELAPIPGLRAPDYAVARLIYEIMGLICV